MNKLIFWTKYVGSLLYLLIVIVGFCFFLTKGIKEASLFALIITIVLVMTIAPFIFSRNTSVPCVVYEEEVQ